MRSGAHRVARRRPGPDVEICLLKSSIGAELAFHLGHDPPGQQADADGIRAVVAQQFAVAAQILAAGLMPIIEPEVDINSPEKGAAEELLKASILQHVAAVPDGQQVMLKLTIPENDNIYTQWSGDGTNVLDRVQGTPPTAGGRQTPAGDTDTLIYP